MKLPKTLLIVACLTALLCTGCFEVETEINLLEDGSGIVTVWTRVPTRPAAISAAMSGTTLEGQKADLLVRLDQLFAEQSGIQLVERRIYSEGEDQVLRYRYAFDNAKALNLFWADEENAKQEMTIYGAQLTVNRSGEDCGAGYDATVAFAPRSEEQINSLGASMAPDQSPQIRQQLVEEFYKGRFRLRLVLPGQNTGTDANQIDTAGNPVWQTTLLDLYRNGLTAKSAAKIECTDGQPRKPEADETYPEPSQPLTVGPSPNIVDVLQTFASLGDLVFTEILVDVDKRTTIQINIHIDERIDQPFGSMMIMPFVLLPTLAEQWEATAGRDEQGRFLLQIKTKKPIRLDETESPFLFAGRDEGRYVFRMRLPQLSFAANRPPDAVGPVVFKVKVKMPGPIETGNATIMSQKEATWLLTSRDLMQQVVLEAICEK